MENSICVKQTRIKDNFFMGLIYLSAFIAVGLLVGIICYVAFRGVSSISWQFLSTIPSTLEGTFGILGNIVNTLYIIVIHLLLLHLLVLGQQYT